MRETSPVKEVAFLPFSLVIFSDDNYIAKLVVDMCGNCFNRLSVIVQSYSPPPLQSPLYSKPLPQRYGLPHPNRNISRFSPTS